MAVTVADWLWVLVTLVAAGAFTFGVFVVVRRSVPDRPLSETLLLTSIVTALALYAEPYLLSFLPLERPLRLLPLAHVLLTAALLACARWRYGVGIARETLRALAGRSWAFLRTVGPVLTVALVGLVVLLGVYAAYGAYTVPTFWDDLWYHVPMAVQPWQDGRVDAVPNEAAVRELGVQTPRGQFRSDSPQPSLFPRGVEMLWYWTLQWTSTDLLFHAVLLALGVQLLLAIYVLARRLGAAPWAATVAALAMASTPIFYLLTTTGYVDIGTGASVVALAAFLAPDGRPGSRGLPNWGAAALALGEACIVKYPFLALVVGGVLAVEAVLFRVGPWRGLLHLLRFVFSWRGVAALVIVAGCAQTYVGHYLRYRNPFYAFRITVAGHEIFPGWHDPGTTNLGGESTAVKPIPEMSRPELYYHAWTDFRAPLTCESFGSFAEVFPCALLVPALVFALWGLLTFNTPVVAATLGVLLCLAFTPVAPPRYGLPIVAILFVFGMRMWSELRGRLTTAVTLAVLALCTPGLARGLAHFRWWMHVYRDGGPVSWTARNRSFHEKYIVSPPHAPSLPMIKYIREHAGAGDRLVWTVHALPTLLYNSRWTNELYFLPGLPEKESWPAVPGRSPVPPDRLNAWLAELRRLAPRHVLLYTKSDYARGLLEHPELGYREVFRDDDPARKEFAMVLFERGAPAPATAPASSAASAPAPASTSAPAGADGGGGATPIAGEEL